MELMTSYQKLLQSFAQFIRVRNYRGGDARYTPYLKEFLFWIQSQGISDIHQVTNEYMIYYYEYLCTRPNKRLSGTLSDSSINNHLFAIRLFYENLLEQQVISKTILVPSRQNLTKKDRQILTVSQIKKMYKTCQSERETALLSVAYGCGLRRNEIHQLDAKDIILSKGILIVKKGKLGKRREVPMSDQVIEDIKIYLLGERTEILIKQNKPISSFFINYYGARTSGGYLNKIVQRIAHATEDSEIIGKNITLHCLRHSIATHLSEQGASMEFVREFLGHSEIDTSQIYAKRRKRNNIFKI